MLTVPLGEAAPRVLEAALRDPAVVARYRAKLLEVPGSGWWWWQGAVSGRGHGRLYVGTVGTVGTGATGQADDIYDDHRAFHLALIAPAVTAWG